MWKKIITIEAVTQRCSVKKVFLEISQNSKENNCARKITLSLLFSCQFCEITKNTFFYRAPLVAPSNYYRHSGFFLIKLLLFSLSSLTEWSFLLEISIVNVNKSAENCRFAHIYKRNPQGKTFCTVWDDNDNNNEMIMQSPYGNKIKLSLW